MAAAEAAELGFSEVREHAETRLRGFAPSIKAATLLRTAVSSYAVMSFDVPRPKSLLAHQHLHAIAEAVNFVRQHAGPEAFTGLRLEGAGNDTPVFRRLGDELAQAAGLAADPVDGDLVVRVVRATHGWEALVRLTPRPLSARPWRVADLRGALNASIAAAMVRLSPAQGPAINLMGGSATIAIEHALVRGEPAIVLDNAPASLAAARRNIAASRADVHVVGGDATTSPFPARVTDLVYCDPPYGDAMGSHRANDTLYPALLAEAARLCRPGGCLVAISHEIRRFTEGVGRMPAWDVIAERQVFQKGHHPKIWILRRVDL